jgi:hypothetical protein
MTVDANNSLVEKILSTEITVSGERFDEMVKWLLENVGEERPYHPLEEAMEGYIDYFDGEWAMRWDQGTLKVWFWSKTQAAKFALFWM